MHIIKITSASFKIILTKEDVDKYTEKFVKNDYIDSRGFLSEIRNKTNTLFDCPFDELTLDAEFFQSKDGGGELFLTAKIPQILHNYCFKTKESDKLLSLCKRLLKADASYTSKLYCMDCHYYLVLTLETALESILISIASEYGEFFNVQDMYEWQLCEHGKCIFEDCAVEQIVEKF